MLRLVVALTTCSIVSAQQPGVVQSLGSNPNFRATAEKTFLQYEDSLSTHCKEITPDWAQAQQTIYVAPVVDAQNHLASGLWSEMVPGTACGEARNFRALVLIRDGRISLGRQLPGTSNTTPVLEKDVRLAAISALRAKYSKDDLPPAFDVFDTRTIGPNPPAAHHTWKEIWSVRINGREMRIAIDFIPDETGGGTTFQIDSRTIAYISSTAKP
jgi:hypothetical protein